MQRRRRLCGPDLAQSPSSHSLDDMMYPSKMISLVFRSWWLTGDHSITGGRAPGSSFPLSVKPNDVESKGLFGDTFRLKDDYSE